MTQDSALQASREFKAWREKQVFKTPEIAHRAELVQFDLDALAKMEAEGHEVASFKELARKNIAELVALLDARTMG